MGERPRFRRAAPPPPRREVRGMVALLLVVGVALLLVRVVERPSPAARVPVQVVGEVPRPGWYELAHPTVRAAVAAAGGAAGDLPASPVPPGHRVRVEGGEVRVEPSGEELVFGLPLDLNTAPVEALEALPGVGGVTAAAIVAWREEHGPFARVEDLEAVPGIGPARRAALEPFVTVAP